LSVVREDFKQALHRFMREFQGSVNIPFGNEDPLFENYKSEEEALRNARHLETVEFS